MQRIGTFALCLLAAVLAAVSTARAEPETFWPCCFGGTCHLCPGLLEAWGDGKVSTAVQPGTSTPCDLSHPCQITANGTLEGKTLFKVGAEVGRAAIVLVQTIDFSAGAANGTGGKCYPSGGHVTITPEGQTASTLILDFQGSACEWSSATNAYLFQGPWTADDASSGTFKHPVGIGTTSVDIPSNLERITLFINGNLHADGGQPQ
jgi:hypothetical protein